MKVFLQINEESEYYGRDFGNYMVNNPVKVELEALPNTGDVIDLSFMDDCVIHHSKPDFNGAGITATVLYNFWQWHKELGIVPYTMLEVESN